MATPSAVAAAARVVLEPDDRDKAAFVGGTGKGNGEGRARSNLEINDSDSSCDCIARDVKAGEGGGNLVMTSRFDQFL